MEFSIHLSPKPNVKAIIVGGKRSSPCRIQDLFPPIRIPTYKFSNELHNSHKRVSGYPSVIENGKSVVIHCELNVEKEDSFYMRRCVELAKNAMGCTSPNPMVGCVIVKDGMIVGEGFHPKAGQWHAEVFALKDAGDLAENATAYVSLEPCNHYGRTPPCTEALIQAKIKRVVVGMVDPNPIVASKGVIRLRESGIEVKVGVEEKSCRKLNEAYIHRMLTGKPFTSMRFSLSFNGYMLNQPGPETEKSGGYYSQLLKEYDSVIISLKALAQCSTFPFSQEIGANQPLWITIAGAECSSCFPSLLDKLPCPATVVVDKSFDLSLEAKSICAAKRIELLVLDKLKLNLILDHCGGLGMCNVLMDLRGDFDELHPLLEEGLEENLIQKVVLEICSIWGQFNNNPFGVLKQFEGKLPRLKDFHSRISNESIIVEGYLC